VESLSTTYILNQEALWALWPRRLVRKAWALSASLARWHHSQEANSSFDARQRPRPPLKSHTADSNHSKRLQWCPRCQFLLKTAWHWTWQPGRKKAPQRRHGGKSRLAAPETTLDTIESAASTDVIILAAADAIDGHSGDYEGAHDQLEHLNLRRHKKIEIR
jgi:hypothetical protein